MSQCNWSTYLTWDILSLECFQIFVRMNFLKRSQTAKFILPSNKNHPHCSSKAKAPVWKKQQEIFNTILHSGYCWTQPWIVATLRLDCLSTKVVLFHEAMQMKNKNLSLLLGKMLYHFISASQIKVKQKLEKMYSVPRECRGFLVLKYLGNFSQNVSYATW